MDMLLSTGERISCALCAMAIHDMGHHAISLTGSQAGIVTDSSHTKARILDVRADRIRDGARPRTGSCSSPASRASPATAATSPRSGAAARTRPRSRSPPPLGADVCEIYTDVAGVFSADPRIVPDARKLKRRLVRRDARDVRPRAPGCCSCASVEYARNHGVRIHCRSSFEDGPGTLVLAEDETMERPLVTAVTHAYEARVTLTGLSDEPGVAGRVFGALADANVNVDMIIQNEPVSADSEGRPLVHRRPRRPARARPTSLGRSMSARERSRPTTEVGKVSIVGAGMRSHPGVAAKVFQTLGEQRDQHRDDLHLADQDLLRDRGRPGARRGARAARGVRARRRRGPRGGPDRASTGPRVTS